MMPAAGLPGGPDIHRTLSPARQTGPVMAKRGGERGTVAIELALGGPLFLLTCIAVLHVALTTLTQTVLDDAVRRAARQVQIAAISRTAPAGVIAAVCAELAAVAPGCASALHVYAAAGPGFAALPPATINGGTLTPATYAAGTAGQDVVLAVAYTRPAGPAAAVLGALWPTVLLSTYAFQNEPE